MVGKVWIIILPHWIKQLIKFFSLAKSCMLWIAKQDKITNLESVRFNLTHIGGCFKPAFHQICTVMTLKWNVMTFSNFSRNSLLLHVIVADTWSSHGNLSLTDMSYKLCIFLLLMKTWSYVYKLYTHMAFIKLGRKEFLSKFSGI